MPPRPRRSRRQTDELDAWRGVFECEFDFDNDLDDAGIPVDEYGLPDREKAREAWSRLGAQFMSEWRTQPHHSDALEPWALTEFGEPPCR